MVDQGRFERVWHDHGSAILRYCRFTVGCDMTGEDIATETFVRFLEKGGRIPDEKVEAWLFAVAHNLCISHHRKVKRWSALVPVIGRTLSDHEDVHEDGAARAMLATLNERQRLAVFLRIVEDRPFSEVSRVLRISEGASKKLVERALCKLRSSMTEVQPGSSATPEGGVERAR